jgi:hypothetical protein
MALLDKEKPTYRGYIDYLNYLLQVNAAGGGHFDRNLLKSIVHRSGTDHAHEISSKCERNRTDYIDHAAELADFADELWNERNLSKSDQSPDGSVVNAVVPRRPNRHVCHNCQKKGHLESVCREKKQKSFGFGKTEKKQYINEDFPLGVSCQDEDKTTDQSHHVWPRNIK